MSAGSRTFKHRLRRRHRVSLQQGLRWWQGETSEVWVELTSSTQYPAASASSPSLLSYQVLWELKELLPSFPLFPEVPGFRVLPTACFLHLQTFCCPYVPLTPTHWSHEQAFLLCFWFPFSSRRMSKFRSHPRKTQAEFSFSCFNSQLLNSLWISLQ